MVAEPQNPEGVAGANYISISSSSEDEEHSVSVQTPKRKRSAKSVGVNGSAGGTAEPASTDRSQKRTRLSSPADDTMADGELEAKVEAKVSEEGEVGEDEAASEAEAEAEAAAKKAAKAAGALRVFVPDDPPIFVQDSLSFRLPVFSQKRKGSWVTRFGQWAELFYTSNPEHGAVITPAVVRAAWMQYIDCHSGLRQAKRRDAKDASAKQLENGELAEQLETLRFSAISQQQADSRQQADASEENGHAGADEPSDEGGVGSTSKDPAHPQINNGLEEPATAAGAKKGLPSGDEALAQQRRYFPSASDPTDMCLLCGRQGHVAVDCQDSVCRFCGRDDHWDYVCPTIPTRCGKCHQLGHSTDKCVEKLALTRDEGLECLYCKAPDHLEDDCTEWWRSYEPLALAVKTISYLPSTCAICGSQQHYAGDCTSRLNRVVNPTWTLRNRNLYIDPESTSTAIEESYSEVGKPRAGQQQQSELRIRGSAASRTHIQYESEDSDTEFLGHRASGRKPKVGQIRVSSNIQMPNEQHRPRPQFPPGPPPVSSGPPSFPPGGPRGRISFNPPPPEFPPGPPAQLPGLPAPPRRRGNNSSTLSQAPGPPPSLPTRPPVRTFHGVPPPASLSNDSRGGFGGRGRGRGGRGRGRGRG